ncbi:cation diffusion facilitator family transporter [Paradevosia shaoguanensis]|uniref:Protein p34 n=1 Tax=Paradevosia shaoguanensis TaxID=1335043 RepID=A0AA41QS32_9HYPH|nr:cation diffusion facilitator family transporter [Paradevosia shaoguanensis]KFL26500.1 cadmium transporter [Devosia sp. 17-2-E-8]MCF1744133.1 cation diffusion facilitator family transporter [Paradevosia shaoguanensis]MCI0128616.1 cation diffusion facilitator family transporter [Paradevosia shaoguanensis]QMV03873.1 cation diffusion facilitator family transporter [Devosia sp. D6-9]
MARHTHSPVALQLAMGSLVVGVVVLGLKGFAAWATGSIALFSDALESVVNVVTAVVTLIAVRLAARPANDTLPYGYHKAEYFSAVIVGVFIVVAALLIFREAYYGFMSPRAFVADPLGLAVSVIASVLNMAWAYLLISRGRRERSPALQADGKHLLTDVISTFGVLVGVGLVIVTGWQRLDAILAALVGLSILWSGWQLLRDSVIGLMDVAVDARQLMRIKEIISANAEGAIEAHDIRTRQAGSATFIEFHLVVPGSMTVEAAHVICDRIEAKLREAESDATVTIHVEPEDKAKHSGIVVI